MPTETPNSTPAADSGTPVALPPHTLAAVQSALALLPALRWLLGLSIAALLIAGLFFGKDILMPLALAFLLSFLLDPAVTRLKRWGLPRAAASLVVVAVVLGVLVGLGTYLGGQVKALSSQLPTYQNTIREKLVHVREMMQGPGFLDGVLSTYDTVDKEISKAKEAQPDVQKVEVVETSDNSWATALAWLSAVSGPIATLGIVLLFVILMLLGRDDLRDRLLRLVGGNLHIATDAMDEASERIGSYLRMQFVVNVTYGIPMALGLWWIGVPGAVLWGVLATVMRFVPYVGPMISAVFPLLLAFAVAPGWDMVLWTMGLILVLELISNNVVEPLLYGASTGLSTLSIILAATFWTALWGPMGLILSTPLTVCLLVIGRYLPGLHFLEVLLGSEPVLDLPKRLYQRLLVDDVEEALEVATDTIQKALPSKPEPADTADAVLAFYDQGAVPALRLASQHYAQSSSVGQRLRLSTTMGELLQELAQDFAPQVVQHNAQVHCVGVRWDMDVLAAQMASHALALRGLRATTQPHPLAMTGIADEVLAEGATPEWVVLSVFHPQPQAIVRLMLRRLRRQLPHSRVVLAVWSAPPQLLEDGTGQRLGVQAVVSGMQELVLRMQSLMVSADPLGGGALLPVPLPDNERERVQALHASGLLGEQYTLSYQEVVQKAANAFDVRYAQVSLVDAEQVLVPASLLPESVLESQQGIPRETSVCAYVAVDGEALVVPDVARDPRFADNAALQQSRVRFYAGVPIKDKDDHVLGVLCLMHDSPREMSDEDIDILEGMAQALMDDVRSAEKAASKQAKQAAKEVGKELGKDQGQASDPAPL